MSLKSQCLLIAGELSGQEHAMSFFPELRRQFPQLSFFGVGGDELQKNGMELLFHLKEFSSWGISEVLEKIPFYLKAERLILNEVDRRESKVAILIDFQSFNMKLAKKLKARGVRVLYYVAPQAWAWKSWRVEALKENVHTLFTIIPFEKKWFSERGLPHVLSVKHPVLGRFEKELADHASELRAKALPAAEEELVLLLLPGSRPFEVGHLLPRFVEVAQELRKSRRVRTLLVAADSIDEKLYAGAAEHIDEILPSSALGPALLRAHLALAASGTVTLTCALYQVPTVVCYASSLFNAFCYFTFVSYRGPVSLANIVHNHRLFPELLQDSATSFNILRELHAWLESPGRYQQTRQQLALTSQKLQGELDDVPGTLGQLITTV